jgi:putative inorganic carbon (HCO3(-)) transporter
VGATLLIAVMLYREALAVAALAFAYPFDLVMRAGPVKVTTSAAMMGIIVVVWLVRQATAQSWRWNATGLDLPIVAFAMATVLSLLSGTGNLDQQLVGVAKSFGGFLIFFMVTQTVKDKSDAWWILGAVLLSGVLQATWSTVQVLNGSQIVSDSTRATGSVIDPNIWAGYLILLIPLVVAVGLSFQQRWTLGVTCAAFIVLAIALVASLSRSGWLGLAVATACLALLLRTDRWKVLLLVGGVGAALLAIGLYGPIAARLGPGSQGPVSMLLDRWNVWVDALVIFSQHPIFGVGVMNLVTFMPSNSIPGTEILRHAHNIFLNMAAERGVIGLATFVVIVWVLFRSLWRAVPLARTRLDYALIAGLLATFAGYFVHSIFEVSYYDYKVLLLFWILVGVAAVVPKLLTADVVVALHIRDSHLVPEAAGG